MPNRRSAPLRLAALLLALAFAVPAAAGKLQAVPAQALPKSPDANLTRALAQHKGGAMVISFWASWCEPCHDEMPAVQRLSDRWRTRGVSFLAVAVGDQKDRASAMLWDLGVSVPQLHDPDKAITRAFGVRTIPTTLILDRRHRIVARATGVLDWDDPAVDRQMQSLLQEPKSR